MDLPLGTLITPNGVYSGLWALPRPLTSHWGSGAIMERIEKVFGKCDIIFGKQDQVEGFTVDKDPSVNPSLVSEWADMDLANNSFHQGYWDPPYLGYIGEDGDVHYNRMNPSLMEICRVVSERLLILSPLIYPCPRGWEREAVIAVTYGPNKIIRSLQGFVKKGK